MNFEVFARIGTWVLVPQGDVIPGDSQLGISKPILCIT